MCAASSAATSTHHRSLALVVHGIGTQPKASTLKVVSENFLPLIRRLDPHAEVEAKPLDAEGLADVTFRFAPQGSTDRYEVRFAEVWWAQSFQAPGLGALLVGGIVAFWQRWIRQGAPAKWYTYVIRLLGEALSAVLFNALAVVMAALLIPLGLVLSVIAALPKKPLWTPLMASWHEGVLARVGKIQPMVVETAIILLIPVFLLVLFALWLIQTIVPRAALSSPLKEIHAALVNIATNQFGDMWCYLYQPWEASRITTRFREAFAQEVTEACRRPGGVESVIVIAHSMGTVVAYEALTGDALKPLIQERFGKDGAKLLLTSVGSALNLAWDTAPSSERFRLERRLPSEAGWLNVWSEYDPVAGEPLRLPAAAWRSRVAQTQAAAGLHAPLQQRGVVNQMDIFSDHSAYWNNTEEVLAPLLDRLTNYAFSDSLRLNVPARRIRVRVLAGFKAAAWLLALAAFGFAALLPRQLDHVGDFIVDQLRKVTPQKIAEQADSAWATLVDVVPEALLEAVLLSALVAFLYSSLVKLVWNNWDRHRKYDPAPPALGSAGGLATGPP